MFERETQTFELHKPQLLANHAGDYALVFGDDLEGVYDSEMAAYDEGVRRHGLEAFLIKHIVAQEPMTHFVSFAVQDDGNRAG